MAFNIFGCANLRLLDQEESAFRRKALKDAVVCIGWLKLISVICYIGMYFLILNTSKGTQMSKVFQYLILVIIPFNILNGLFLLLGALKDWIWALQVGLCLCLTKAAYETALGVVGGIYFIRNVHSTIHYLVAGIFGLMVISVISELCDDVRIIRAYIKLLESSGES